MHPLLPSLPFSENCLLAIRSECGACPLLPYRKIFQDVLYKSPTVPLFPLTSSSVIWMINKLMLELEFNGQWISLYCNIYESFLKWSASWSLHFQPRDQCMHSHVISVWSVTWSVYDHPHDQCMLSYMISAL